MISRFVVGLLHEALVSPFLLILWILQLCGANFENLFAHDHKKPLMILVHGNNSSSLQWLFPRIFYLRKYYNTYAIDYNCKQNPSIEQISRQIKHKINSIDLLTPEHPVLLVGLSMGGLAVTHYIQSDALKPKNMKAVTINSPLRGAGILNVLKFKDIRYQQMTPGSHFLAQLQETPNEIPLYSFGSKYDSHVSKRESNLFGENRHEFEHSFGHTSVIYWRSFWESVKDVIDFHDLAVEDFLIESTKYFDESHDAQHAMKVYENAMKISETLIDRMIDPKILKFCALLHDVIDHKYVGLGKSISRNTLERFIKYNNIKYFFEVIDNISYSKQKKEGDARFQHLTKPYGIYYAIVSDADKLEALGKEGIKRCAQFAKILHPNTSDDFITEKVIEHCNEKLLYLPNYLFTYYAKQDAKFLVGEIRSYIRKNTKKEDPSESKLG